MKVLVLAGQKEKEKGRGKEISHKEELLPCPGRIRHYLLRDQPPIEWTWMQALNCLCVV